VLEGGGEFPAALSRRDHTALQTADGTRILSKGIGDTLSGLEAVIEVFQQDHLRGGSFVFPSTPAARRISKPAWSSFAISI
jgi:hypothetical protein